MKKASDRLIGKLSMIPDMDRVNPRMHKEWQMLDSKDSRKKKMFGWIENLKKWFPDTWEKELKNATVSSLHSRITEVENHRKEEKRMLGLLTTGTYKRIIGPISLTEHYHKTWDIQIFVFGDWHKQFQTCVYDDEEKNKLMEDKSVRVPRLIKYLLQKGSEQQQPVDFFLEIDFLTPKHSTPRDWDSMQGTLQRYFRKCFRRDKSQCSENPTLNRFHYTDIRRIVTEGALPWDLIHSSPFAYGSTTEPSYDNIKEVLNDTVKKLTNPKLVEQQFKLLKIEKQWENVPLHIVFVLEPYFRDVIVNKAKQIIAFNYLEKLNFIEKEEDESARHRMLNKWGIPKNSREQHETKNRDPPKWVIFDVKEQAVTRLLEEFEEQLFLLSMFFMDAYLLGRLFRQYSDGSPTARRVIIYAGDAHADHYRSILRKLKFVDQRPHEKDVHDQSSWQCIPVTKPLQWIAL
jgi:hypothetical protein